MKRHRRPAKIRRLLSASRARQRLREALTAQQRFREAFPHITETWVSRLYSKGDGTPIGKMLDLDYRHVEERVLAHMGEEASAVKLSTWKGLIYGGKKGKT